MALQIIGARLEDRTTIAFARSLSEMIVARYLYRRNQENGSDSESN
jgi:hypothetical protein